MNRGPRSPSHHGTGPATYRGSSSADAREPWTKRAQILPAHPVDVIISLASAPHARGVLWLSGSWFQLQHPRGTWGFGEVGKRRSHLAGAANSCSSVASESATAQGNLNPVWPCFSSSGKRAARRVALSPGHGHRDTDTDELDRGTVEYHELVYLLLGLPPI